MLFIRRLSLRNGTFVDVGWIQNQKTLRRFSSENRGNSSKFVQVSTTGYSFVDKETGERVARYGVFWGADDARNGIRTLPRGRSNVAAMLTAILEVCHVAREEEPPPSLLIYSDMTSSDDLLRDLSQWAKRDFYQRNGGDLMRNADILKDLFTAVQGLHIRIAFKPSARDGTPGNTVMEAIRADADKKKASLAEQVETEGTARFCRVANVVEPVARMDFVGGSVLDKNGKPVQTGGRSDEKWPKVYVAARTRAKDSFISAGYCTHWPRGEFGGGRSFRFAPFPITLFRAELAAVEEALKEAVDTKTIRRLVVSVPSAHFMNAWRKRWIRDGEETERRFFNGKAFFDRITDLCDRLDEVHFRFEMIGEQSAIGKELEKKCTEGLGYEVVPKDTSEYALEMEDMVRMKEQRIEGVPIVHLFKTGTPLNAGFVWSNEKEEGGVSCCGFPSTLITILEEAVRRGEPTIVIRTDSGKLIRSFEANLEVWRRNGWRNSRHKRIGRSREWEHAWELKQRVQVLWELMDPVEPEDRAVNSRIPEYTKQQ